MLLNDNLSAGRVLAGRRTRGAGLCLLGTTLLSLATMAVPTAGRAATYTVRACDASLVNRLFVPRWDNSADFSVSAACDSNGRLKVSAPVTSRAYQTGGGLIATHPRTAERIGDSGWGKIRTLTGEFEAANNNGWIAGLLNDGDATASLTWALGPGNRGRVRVPSAAGENWAGAQQQWTWGVSLFSYCSLTSCPGSNSAVAALKDIALEVSDDYAPTLEAPDNLGSVTRGTALAVSLKASDPISGVRRFTAVSSKGATVGEALNQCDAYSWVPCQDTGSAQLAVDTSSLGAGENLLRLAATDYAGNSVEKTAQVTVIEPPKPLDPVIPENLRGRISIKMVTVTRKPRKGKPRTSWHRILRIPDPSLASKLRSRSAAQKVNAVVSCTPASSQAACRIRRVSVQKRTRQRSAATIIQLGAVPVDTSLRLTLSQSGRADSIWNKSAPLDD